MTRFPIPGRRVTLALAATLVLAVSVVPGSQAERGHSHATTKQLAFHDSMRSTVMAVRGSGYHVL